MTIARDSFPVTDADFILFLQAYTLRLHLYPFRLITPITVAHFEPKLSRTCASRCIMVLFKAGYISPCWWRAGRWDATPALLALSVWPTHGISARLYAYINQK